MLQRSDEGIVLLDRHGLILEHNQRFHELMNFRTSRGVPLSEDALRGRVLASLLSAEFNEVARGLFANEEMWQYVEYRGRSLEIGEEGEHAEVSPQRGQRVTSSRYTRRNKAAQSSLRASCVIGPGPEGSAIDERASSRAASRDGGRLGA